MMFPIKQRQVEEILHIMEKKPKHDFSIEFKVDKGILLGMELVYTEYDDTLEQFVKIHIPIEDNHDD